MTAEDNQNDEPSVAGMSANQVAGDENSTILTFDNDDASSILSNQQEQEVAEDVSIMPPPPPVAYQRTTQQSCPYNFPLFSEATSSTSTTQRKSKNTILLDMINNGQNNNKIYRKHPSQLTSSKAMQQRADDGLAYLIYLCGFCNVDSLVKNEKIYSELLLMISEIKARAIATFKLPPESIDVVDYTPRDDDVEDTASIDSTSTSASINSYLLPDLESHLHENLAKGKYLTTMKLFSGVTNGEVQMRTSYHILKKSQEMVELYQIKNVEYDQERERVDNSATSLSSNLMRDAENNKITFKGDLKVPEFLFGAYLPLDTAMNLIYDRVRSVTSQVENASINDALGTSMLIGCADAAEMDSLPKITKHVTSFSLVPVSKFLIEDCALYPSSIYNILPHNQLNSKELLEHLKHVLKERFNGWLSIREASNFNIDFIDMHDAKFTYVMIQCSAWSRKHSPFSACRCRRGQGSMADHVCIMFTQEEYKMLFEKSEERFNSQRILAAVRRDGSYTLQDHRNWVDKFNSGVSHLGIPPKTWNVQSLVYDVFHGRSNYVKLQVKYIRKLFEGNYDSLDKFSCFLVQNLKTWGCFHTKQWINNEKTSRLKGENTKEFTRKTGEICKKLKELLSNRDCDQLCVALYAFQKVHLFLTFSIIDDYETANAWLNTTIFSQETPRNQIASRMIHEFERLSNELYRAGMNTYLSDLVMGDHETFYAHAMKNYFVAILKITYRKYGLGLGVFTMEGFEAINYSTKQILRNRSNHRGNICAQSMVHMVNKYSNHYHDVAASSKQREKTNQKS